MKLLSAAALLLKLWMRLVFPVYGTEFHPLSFIFVFLLGLLSPVSHWVYGVCSWCYCLALFPFLSIRFLWLPFQVFRFSSSMFVCFPLFLIQNEEVWGSTQNPKAKRRGIVEMCYPSPNECFLIPKLHSSALGFVFLMRWQKLNFRLSSSLCVCVFYGKFCFAKPWLEFGFLPHFESPLLLLVGLCHT